MHARRHGISPRKRRSCQRPPQAGSSRLRAAFTISRPDRCIWCEARHAGAWPRRPRLCVRACQVNASNRPDRATILQAVVWLDYPRWPLACGFRAPGSAIEERRVMTRMEYGVVVAVLLVLIATVFVSQ